MRHVVKHKLHRTHKGTILFTTTSANSRLQLLPAGRWPYKFPTAFNTTSLNILNRSMPSNFVLHFRALLSEPRVEVAFILLGNSDVDWVTCGIARILSKLVSSPYFTCKHLTSRRTLDFLHGVGAKGFFSEYFSRCYFRFMCAHVNRLGYCPRVIHPPMCGEILTVQGGHSLHIYKYYHIQVDTKPSNQAPAIQINTNQINLKKKTFLKTSQSSPS